MKPLISTIVPIYNAETTIKRCVESLLINKLHNIEIILVDDGSKDNSGKLCDDIAKTDRRIKVIHQNNAGVSNARNNGIELATGDWISFVDSDDWVSEDYYDTLLSAIHQKEFDILFWGAIDVFPNRQIKKCLTDGFYTGVINMQEEIVALKTAKCYNLFGFTWNKLFKADIILRNKIRFERALSLNEDEVFTLDYLRYCSNIATTSSALYFYNKSNETSLTSKKKMASDYLLLSECYNRNVDWFSFLPLRNYYLLAVANNILNATKTNNCADLREQLLSTLQAIPYDVIKSSKRLFVLKYFACSLWNKCLIRII